MRKNFSCLTLFLLIATTLGLVVMGPAFLAVWYGDGWFLLYILHIWLIIRAMRD